jgi:NSS family neurotransmitter:Na+ symporter
MMGLFGGGAFLLLYLLIVALFGIPALMAEMALGRHTRRGPLTAFTAAGLPGGKFFGGVLYFGVAMAMSYYLVVVGWILAYVFLALGNLFGMVDDFGPQTFAGLQANWPLQVLCAVLVAAASAEVVGRGVRVGIERVSRLFVPMFAVLMILLAVRSLTLPGAMQGVVYLLTPDWGALTPRAGLAAVGQAFFSLGLGGTFFVIYASYLPDKGSLRRRAVTTAGGDVAASLLAGLAIMPAVFATGLSPASGPALLFEVVPAACAAMPGGVVFAVVFFLGLGCVAFLSGVAAVEVLVGSLTEILAWPRRATAWILCAALVVVGLPATMSLEYLFRSDLIWGSTMQPAGSVIALAALTWGLGRSRTLSQLRDEDGELPRWANFWFFWVRYVVPIAVIVALLSGWILN